MADPTLRVKLEEAKPAVVQDHASSTTAWTDSFKYAVYSARTTTALQGHRQQAHASQLRYLPPAGLGVLQPDRRLHLALQRLSKFLHIEGFHGAKNFFNVRHSSAGFCKA